MSFIGIFDRFLGVVRDYCSGAVRYKSPGHGGYQRPKFCQAQYQYFAPLFLLGKGYWGVLPAAGIVGACSIVLALGALWKIEETFHKYLNYLEPE
ncbi:MAG: transporter [Mucilaginibacter sp.]|nr:transporter [Mucilaginibacter sp.]